MQRTKPPFVCLAEAPARPTAAPNAALIQMAHRHGQRITGVRAFERCRCFRNVCTIRATASLPLAPEAPTARFTLAGEYS